MTDLDERAEIMGLATQKQRELLAAHPDFRDAMDNETLRKWIMGTMTDLEKLAREHASKMAAELEDGIRLGVREGGGGDVAVNERMVAYLERQLSRAYAAGRIEGLKEAEVLTSAHYCDPGTNGVVSGPVPAQAIRARIQELEGVRDTCELVSFVIEGEVGKVKELEPSDDASH
ncbi:MAG: hypothetical protein KF821_01790 [Anaerolineales bacterium]|nr:hypothetical protein [Anaerolineales bacterium]